MVLDVGPREWKEAVLGREVPRGHAAGKEEGVGGVSPRVGTQSHVLRSQRHHGGGGGRMGRMAEDQSNWYYECVFSFGFWWHITHCALKMNPLPTWFDWYQCLHKIAYVPKY